MTQLGDWDVVLARGGRHEALRFLEAVLRRGFPGRVAATSSFGAEAAVLLDLVGEIDPATPVIFIDTGRHFPETLSYARELVAHLGLRDVRTVGPEPAALLAKDPNGMLAYLDSDACCAMRRVEPLAEAMHGFAAWITGRKRYEGGERGALAAIEEVGGVAKVNPLAYWTAAMVEDAFRSRRLPRHPLAADGFRSIGCMPCTRRVAADDESRAGRWAGSAKTECGIHRATWMRRQGS